MKKLEVVLHNLVALGYNEEANELRLLVKALTARYEAVYTR